MKYYLVGANWSGEKQNESFYRRGYWEMGYTDAEKPDFARIRDGIASGDRIAIKSMDGQGATTISIHALGIVKEVFQGRIYVDWVVTGLERHVNSRGCFSTIHGPYSGEDPWVQSGFCIQGIRSAIMIGICYKINSTEVL